jgi:hypothetical protein
MAILGRENQQGGGGVPVVQIQMNVELARQTRQSLLIAVARLVAESMQKPLADVMVFMTYADFVMDGTFAPAAFVDFRCLSGLQEEGVTQCLCEGILKILQQHTAIEPNRLYINFFEVCPEYAWRFRDGMAVCPKMNSNER